MNNHICDNCPVRLFNTKSYNLQGIGNPFYGNCIVVSNVDYKAYKNKNMAFSTQVEIIENILSFPTGVEDSNLYIVPLIRCNELISCEIDSTIYTKCFIHFANDIRKYDFKNILLLGKAAIRFLNIDNISNNLNNCYISPNNRKYFVNYSPFVVDNIRFSENFKTNLIEWYNNCNNNYNNYNKYKIIKI